MLKGGKYFLIILFLVFSSQLTFWPIAISEAGAFGLSVVINEIAWNGTLASANDEWIELYNNNEEAVDLTGWVLAASDNQPKINLSGQIAGHGYFLLERTSDDTISDIVADQIYTGALSNSGEKLELKNANGEVVDGVDCLTGWFSGDNITKASMERKKPDEAGGQDNWASNNGNMVNGKDAKNNNLMATPKAKNSVYEEAGNEPPVTPPPDQQPIGSTTPPNEIGQPSGGGSVATYKLGDVVINELVADPGDGEEEWIELYNTTNNNIDLSGWIIEEGSGAKTNLEGKIGASGEEKYKIIPKPKGNLNNSGDIIILRDSQGNLIDKVTYGDWNDGQLEDNAPFAPDPASVARKFDGQNTYNNANDFTKTLTPTKGAANIITEDEEVAGVDTKNYEYSDVIIINEIFPNPEGVDTAKEFIELQNKGGKDVNLIGWAMESSGKKFLISTSTIIKANGFFVVYRKESKIVLNNLSDTVKLYEPLKEKAKESVKYKQVKEGFSYSRDEDSKWQWSEIETPGAENKIKTENHAPIVDFYSPEKLLVSMPFIFDGSDAFDEDSDELKFRWDFGDGNTSDLEMAEHTFLKQGNFTIKLSVSDGKKEVSKERIVKIVGFGDEDVEIISDSEASIFINELLPNPLGDDASGEWIEIYNGGENKINIFNWGLDNGTQYYIFKKERWLEPGGYYLLERKTSSLTLKNSEGDVALYNNSADLVSEVNYKKATEGESYARDKYGHWLWTNILTPGKVNLFSTQNSSNSLVKTVNKKSTKSVKYRHSSFEAPIQTTLEKVKEFEPGEVVKVKGTVAVGPGIFGSQYFYIIGSPAVQVYNYKKDFPSLQVGDYVEVNGELSEIESEIRLKTRAANDIKFIEHKEAPKPVETTCDRLAEDSIGQLVKIAAEVTGKKGAEIYMDDGESEVAVYLKRGTGIKPGKFSEGDKLRVTGLAINTKNGPRILPRSNEDIEKINEAEEVLGETAATSTWALAARDKKMELLKYLLVLAGGIIIVLIGWLVKTRKKKDKKVE